MKIEVVQRLRPFSHRPGARCLIPGTEEVVTAYPKLLCIGEKEIPIEGNLENFTLQQDLERNCVWVFGKDYKTKIEATEKGIVVDGNVVGNAERHFPQVWERLSLGCHRELDWDLVWRRFDLREILPVVFGLGQKVPSRQVEIKKEDIRSFCLTAFSHMLVPQPSLHLGLSVALSPHPLQEAFFLIRNLFFSQHGIHIRLLPDPLFASGRLIRLQAPGIGELDFEWTKYQPRRVILRAHVTTSVVLEFPKTCRTYRLRLENKFLPTPLLAIEEGKTYHLDRFQ